MPKLIKPVTPEHASALMGTMILSAIWAARGVRAGLPTRRQCLWRVHLRIALAAACNGAMLLQLVRTRALWTFGRDRMAAANGMTPLPTPSAEGDAGTLRTRTDPEGATPEHELFVDELASAGTGGSVPDVKESSGGGACLGGANYMGIPA
ncbi:hypothetical protein CVT25_006175 [Psilocybe cyanescens]|uniref:Uncharacterized protein n=1 Tax=Psilocybe cyanescens TaxID=93625 RepID=A0A409XVU1_PSICY|nr:hypothetical protein CVT25_006175 [Psilocybe cyanescens]